MESSIVGIIIILAGLYLILRVMSRNKRAKDNSCDHCGNDHANKK